MAWPGPAPAKQPGPGGELLAACSPSPSLSLPVCVSQHRPHSWENRAMGFRWPGDKCQTGHKRPSQGVRPDSWAAASANGV